MGSLNIKKGDLVQVITGKDKGVQGKVIAVLVESDKVLVEGVNRIKKHTKVGQTTRGAKAGGSEAGAGEVVLVLKAGFTAETQRSPRGRGRDLGLCSLRESAVNSALGVVG